MVFKSGNNIQIFIVHPLANHMDILCLFVKNVMEKELY